MRNDRLGWTRRGAAPISEEQKMWLLILCLPHLAHISITASDLEERLPPTPCTSPFILCAPHIRK